MSRSNSSSRTRRPLKWWLIIGGACALVAVIALMSGHHPEAPAPQVERRAAGAYRPGWMKHAARTAGHQGAVPAKEGTLPPELEERLQANGRLTVMPTLTSSGAPLSTPPPGPPSPEVQAQLHQALAGWQIQAQQLLDGCVARPKAERQPVPMDVYFAPPGATDGPAPQQLAPIAVSVPVHELRRLWLDTDPDELQACLDRVRTLALPVPPAPQQTAQVLPSSMETLLVQL